MKVALKCMITNPLKYLIIIVLLLLTNYNVQAQVPEKQSAITGKVLDENKEFLPYVSVKLHQVIDSTLVQSVQTNEAGIFQFSKVPAGTYYIEIDLIGYQKSINRPFTLEAGGQKVNLGVIVLQSPVQQLNTVDISVKKPLIERKDGKIIINVSASPLTPGSTAMEILSRVPGVTLDNEGNVSLRGKPGVSLMIDDKLTYLSSAQLANLLRATSGNTIQTIEIISNPSSKYDASGTGGIINIKLKKNTSFGTNGTLTLGGGLGKYHKSDAGIALNHRSKSLNIYGNYNYTYNKQYENLFLTRSTRAATEITYYDQKARDAFSRKNNNYKTGIDYFINENNTIGFMLNGYVNNYDGTNKIKTTIGTQRGKIDSTVLGRNSSVSQYESQTYSLNYKSVLDTLGQELNVDLDLSQVHNMENAHYNNDFYKARGLLYGSPLIFRNLTPSKIKIAAGKLDYTLPLPNKMKVETGIKSSYVNTDNDFRSEQQADEGWKNNESLSNRFSYKEGVNAAYVNLHKDFNSTALQVGLRTELTHSEGKSITLQDEVVRNYIDFFPSLSVNQTLSKDHIIAFSYSRRIDRPDYQSLNPFIYYVDLYTLSQGNPALRPQYANSFEINYGRKKLNISFGYIRTKDVITTTLLTDTIKKTMLLYEQNLAYRRTFSATISRPVNLTDWWSTDNDITLYNSRFASPELMGMPFKNEKTTLELNTIHTFKFSSTLNAELSANYTSSQVYGTYIAKPIYGLDFGVNKSFARERANIKLGINDLFDQRQIKIRSAIPSQDYQLNQKQESRVFRLTFTYNFGSNTIKAIRDRSNSSTSEQGRVKSGN
ncbi:TonB-dependent receptor [Pedobacter ginsengisoli]|uniref:TonB-dependent receptor n=1 Tax=Pedobacter ginsengisoli TaxID=363852 RepID=UPI002551A17E|nr:TonB-dependent receptor [Pedobacter ginsengisoli]